MAKSQILFYFTVSAPGYEGRLAVCATDETKKRSYMLIKGLVNPDYATWNRDIQMFDPTLKASVVNNSLLLDLRVKLEYVIRIKNPRNSEHFLSLFKDLQKADLLDFSSSSGPKDTEPTLGEFVKGVVDKMKSEDYSRHFQLYQSLYHNLMGVSKKYRNKAPKHFKKPEYNSFPLVDTPISEITNSHLAAFADWIKNEKKGSNYRGLTVYMMAVMRKAQSEGLHKTPLTYSFTKNAPRTKLKSLSAFVTATREKSLTPAQIKKVFEFDVDSIPGTGGSRHFWYQLYLDTVHLMYLLMSRPADVVSMTWDMVVHTESGDYLCYIPYKKRGLSDPLKHAVRVPICPKAMELMLKYKGRSAKGYILPFPENEKRCEADTPEAAQAWSLLLARSIRKVDVFLKHVGKHLGLGWPLSLYAFRRSAITHTLEAGVNVMKVAKQAGTSLDMINQTYYVDQA